VLLAIVCQFNGLVFASPAIQPDALDAVFDGARVLHGDVVCRRSEAVGDLELRPIAWDARIQAQLVSLAAEAEDGFQADAIKPARGARVPRPTAAAGVRGVAVDVGSESKSSMARLP